MTAAWRLAANWSLGGEKIVSSLFCMFLIIIISSSISIFFVALLNCSYINP